MLDTYLKEWDALTADLVWQPHPANRPQVKAYLSDAFETLYGGAAGGGKSDLLLGLARTMHGRSLLLRRTFPDLERSLIVRSTEFFGDAKNYNSSKHVWNVDGRRIEFGHMERVGTPQQPKDESQYASAQYDFIGFDQLEQFPEYAYTFMFSRARSATRKHIRVVASANPVGEGVEWIMKRWRAWLVDKTAKPGELKWYYRLTGEDAEFEAPDDTPIWDPKADKGAGDFVTPTSRTFIPAGLKDNPFIDENYKAQLQLLDASIRDALLYGDWAAMLTDDAYQVIPRKWVKLARARWTEAPPESEAAKPLVIGGDIAHGGDDKTVFAPRRGTWLDKLKKYEGKQTPTGGAACDILSTIIGDGAANLDVIGVGASAYDEGRRRNMKVYPVNFSEGSGATDKSGTLTFINMRAELYWKFREALDPETGINLALPPDDELESDLCTPRWSSQTNGIKIESKEDIKKRIGRSPDCGDAAILSLAEVRMQIF